ncbi:MAG: YbaB/EbfC family nucleoid-associated protein [Acidimicrobiales bacterium]
MSGGFELPDIGALLRQAQGSGGRDPDPTAPADVAQDADDDANEASVVGTAGGGMVTVTLLPREGVPSGLACGEVHVDPSAIDPDDHSLLEDLLTVAINDALSRAEPASPGGGGLDKLLGGLSGLGADLPGMLSGLGASLPDLLSGAMQAFGLASPAPTDHPPEPPTDAAEPTDGPPSPTDGPPGPTDGPPGPTDPPTRPAG